MPSCPTLPRAAQLFPATKPLFRWSQHGRPSPPPCVRTPELCSNVRSKPPYQLAPKAASLHLRVCLHPNPPAVPSARHLPAERQESTCSHAIRRRPAFVPVLDQR